MNFTGSCNVSGHGPNCACFIERHQSSGPLTPLPIQVLREQAKELLSWKWDTAPGVEWAKKMATGVLHLCDAVEFAEKEILDRRGQLDLEIHAGMKLKDDLTAQLTQVKAAGMVVHQYSCPHVDKKGVFDGCTCWANSHNYEVNKIMRELSVFDVVEGFEPVDPKVLEAFSKSMVEEVIPAVEKIMWERQVAASQSRFTPLCHNRLVEQAATPSSHVPLDLEWIKDSCTRNDALTVIPETALEGVLQRQLREVYEQVMSWQEQAATPPGEGGKI